MTIDELIRTFGYEGSPHFLRRGDARFETEPGLGHIFRRGAESDGDTKRWQLEGVYGLRDPQPDSPRFVPIVYVCKAPDAAAAQDLHRLVWNQDTVPYVVCHEPKGVRVYSGFRFDPSSTDDTERGVLFALTDFARVESIARVFSASQIDGGSVWRNPRLQIDTRGRVYHRLLDNLQQLDHWLRGPGKLKRDVSHALIGKYVYLRYLRDRGILSDERLSGIWGIGEEEVFSRSATKAALSRLTAHLDEWLNGSIFPLRLSGEDAPSTEHIRKVAGIFAGDEASGQLALDFKVYDFSYIPIETLSLIYEQFLHAEDEAGDAESGKSRGREAGAYYTPLPLVNFTLATVQEHRPLRPGMRVCDPACGSGIFLVQAFRRLVETAHPATPGSPRPKPAELRRLLQESIYGVDSDHDACQVAQLSLVLTLLDYIDPPDLTGRGSTFKLPSLVGHNILHADFFTASGELENITRRRGFDWIVGNPPWKQLKSGAIRAADQPAWQWMQKHAETAPVGMYQLAQAFAWEAPRFLAPDGQCALLVPAMGLFEEPSQGFRQKFFRTFRVHSVANFANLAEVLFDGRARVPCAALFYGVRSTDDAPEADEPITTYSPFVVNQEATRPTDSGERRKLWSLVINGSEIRGVEFRDVATGSGLPWKLAMWGTPWDERLIKRMEGKWDSLGALVEQKRLIVAQGPDLTSTIKAEAPDPKSRGKPLYEKLPQAFMRRHTLDVTRLARLRDVFTFPKDAMPMNHYLWLRLRGGKEGLRVSEAPQVHVSAARNYAVYSEEPIIVPPRQIGIFSPTKDALFLKALSLFLSSDFAFYHQFLRATELGVKRDRATLESLRQLPVPLARLSRAELQVWADLHAELVKLPPRELHEKASPDPQPDLFSDSPSSAPSEATRSRLLARLNELTADALGLDDRERALVHDLVRVRLALNDGKRGEEAMRPPSAVELAAYARRLKQELDDFIADSSERRHRLTILHEPDSAMIEVDLVRDASAAAKPGVLAASAPLAAKLRRTRAGLLHEHAQWVYFERNLRVYRGTKTYVFKPLNRHHWTESAAMLDASEIIGDTLAGAD
jgi:hypothetical protein